MLDRARRVGRDAVRARLVELPVRREPVERRPLRRGLAVRAVHGLRPLEARGRAARAAQLRPRRSRDRHRPPAVVLRAVPARAPDPVPLRGPARAASRSSGPGTQRRSMVYTGNLVQGVLLAETRRRPRRATRTGSPTPSPTRCATSCERCATRSTPKGLQVSKRPPAARAADRGRRRGEARRARAGERPLRAGRCTCSAS